MLPIATRNEINQLLNEIETKENSALVALIRLKIQPEAEPDQRLEVYRFLRKFKVDAPIKTAAISWAMIVGPFKKRIKNNPDKFEANHAIRGMVGSILRYLESKHVVARLEKGTWKRVGKCPVLEKRLKESR